MSRVPDFIKVLELLEKTPKTNDKIKLLKDNEDTPHLQEFLSSAVCETVKFNIKELKEVENETSVCRMGMGVWDTFTVLKEKLTSTELTGHAAISAVNSFLEFCDTPEEKKWYERCIKKDIASTKVGRKIMDTVWPGSVLYWKCMLADVEDNIGKLLAEDGDTFLDGYAYGEIKKNGIRTFQSIFNVQETDEIEAGFICAHAVSRKGLPIHNFNNTTQLLGPIVQGTKFENYMFEGECSVDDDLEDTMSVYGFDFSKTEDSFRSKKTGKVGKGWEKHRARMVEVEEMRSRLKFTIFDLMPMDEWNAKKCVKNYEERRADLVELKALIAEAGLSHKLDILRSFKFKTYSAIRRWADKMMEAGYEGIIIKRPKHLYEWVRSRSWTKCKEECEADVVIIGQIIQKQKYNGDGSKKPPMLGKFIVIDSELRIFEVGTGKGWTEGFYTNALINFEATYWKRVMEILAQKFTDKAAVLPRFNRWRDGEKTWQDVLGEDYEFEAINS